MGISKNDYLYHLIWETEEAKDFRQAICLIIGGAGVAWLGIDNIRFIQKRKSLTESHNELITAWKELFIKSLSPELNLSNVKFELRIYTPIGGIKGRFMKRFYNKTILVLREKNPMCDSFEGGLLEWEVYPDKQYGMVGKCFHEKKIFLDLNLSTNNKYDLKDSHRNKLKNIQFASAIPIVDSDSNENVIAVATLDSKSKLSFNTTQKDIFHENFTVCAAFIKRYVNLK